MVLEDLVASRLPLPAPARTPTSQARICDIVEQLGRAARAVLGVAPLRRTAATSRGSRPRAPAPASGGATFVQMAVDNLADRLPDGFHRSPTSTSRAHDDIVRCGTRGRAHARARRSAPRQPLRRHRRRRPHRLPRLGGDRPLARAARRRVRPVQLDPRRRCAPPTSGRWIDALLRGARRARASTSTPKPRGSSTGCSRSTRGCRRRRTAGWVRSGSRCTSGSAAPSGRPRRAISSAASTCSSGCSAEPAAVQARTLLP